MAAEAKWHEFAARQALAEALAGAVADRLRNALEARGQAVLVVSGGSTPDLFLRLLAKQELDWAAVTITLADERWVPPSDQRSNERFVTLNLLQAQAAKAHFVGLYAPGSDATEAAAVAAEHIAALPHPFDVVILGMGVDGHTASLFPDAPDLAALLDVENGGPSVRMVSAQAVSEPRLTLALAEIVAARHLFLHIEGLPKKEVLLDILAGSVANAAKPIGAVFEHAEEPVEIFWAPTGDTP